uniref:5'-3' exoribonuclease n=1 Tax=Ornithodoros turicata TaxID=34597 RepID=A0A2R5LC27_9ACAR
MGVPAFFRWLSRKYPSIVAHCVEEKPHVVDGVKVPVDTTKPNPNDVEFDNLYLDMNGIIHPCCHPENKPAPKNEDEMMVDIFEYIDRIFSIVRPRRLLYMAIDGVAPRAKMNQQRSRRFRASKESAEKVEEISRIRQELEAKGAVVPPEKPKGEHFDSNCITPGTPFMARLAKCLHYYIHDRLNNDPGWKDIQVILSDANVPGEGEHKIMDYIRRQRANPKHDPNTHHCLCGADADLIMLGLATHEPNFTIIREEFKPNQPRPCELCSQLGHEMKDCQGLAKEKSGEFDELEKPIGSETEFIFIRLTVLREYLKKELFMDNLPFPFDFERTVDDWVFMCFFVGNDFLPHLPSLEIREHAIDRLIRLYKQAVYKTGGYLTENGFVSLKRVQLIMTELGEAEDEIFKQRQQRELGFKRRNKERKMQRKMEAESEARPAWTPRGQFAPVAPGQNMSPVANAKQEAYNMRREGMEHRKNLSAGNTALESMLKPDGNSSDNSPQGVKRKKDDEDSDEEEPHDEVRLWEDGWRERYYVSKFDISADNVAFRYDVAAAYVEGLCWVLRYYYQGCASWKWFFPYHYAPFASDFINIGDLKIAFERGTQPFKPMEQLMSVFPAASKQHLPDPWAELMIDPDSPIIDFYPDDFKVDLNGKKYAWQGVALLPFVDEKRLLETVETVYPLLTEEEKKRNTRGDDMLYVRKGHKGYSYLLGLYEACKNHKSEFDLEPKYFRGAAGKILLSDIVVAPGDDVVSVIPTLRNIPGNAVVCVRYRDPKYVDDFVFPSKRLPGAKDPMPTLKPEDLSNEASRNWRPQLGMAPRRQIASLGDAGRRMVGHAVRSSGGYSEIPPPYQHPPQSDQSWGLGAQSHQGQWFQNNGSRGWRGGGGRGGRGRGGNFGSSYQDNNGGGGYNRQGNDRNRGRGSGWGPVRQDRGGGARHHPYAPPPYQQQRQNRTW